MKVPELWTDDESRRALRRRLGANDGHRPDVMAIQVHQLLDDLEALVGFCFSWLPPVDPVSKTLTFSELRRVSLQRALRWHPRGLEEWSVSDWVTATLGEFGEAANVIKKLNRVRDGLIGNDKSVVELQLQLADELADTFIYLDLLASRVGVDLDVAIIAKFNRTSHKYGFPERLGV